MMLTHWTIKISSSDSDVDDGYYWSGSDDLTINSQEYIGVARGGDDGAFMEISAVSNSIGSPAARAQVRLAVDATQAQRILTRARAIISIELNWIRSDDDGATWTVLPRTFSGRISNPIISNGIYTADIETYSGTVARGLPRYWSHEHQQSRHSSDNGFAMAAAIAQGVDIRWPI